MEIRRVVYGLEQAGLVLLVKPEGAEQKAATSRRRRAGRKQQTGASKAVVDKIINRLKNM
jgi:hypothetical protein